MERCMVLHNELRCTMSMYHLVFPFHPALRASCSQTANGRKLQFFNSIELRYAMHRNAHNCVCMCVRVRTMESVIYYRLVLIQNVECQRVFFYLLHKCCL